MEILIGICIGLSASALLLTIVATVILITFMMNQNKKIQELSYDNIEEDDDDDGGGEGDDGDEDEYDSADANPIPTKRENNQTMN